jgi:hypothetical protein
MNSFAFSAEVSQNCVKLLAVVRSRPGLWFSRYRLVQDAGLSKTSPSSIDAALKHLVERNHLIYDEITCLYNGG